MRFEKLAVALAAQRLQNDVSQNVLAGHLRHNGKFFKVTQSFLKGCCGNVGNILCGSVIRHIVQVHRRDSGAARQFKCNAGQRFVGLKMLNALKFDPFSKHFTEQDNGFLG